MAKIGRNEPCPCGSGKKYKQCCLAKDEQAARVVTAAQAEMTVRRRPNAVCNHCEHELDDAAYHVIGLIENGKLDEAEQAAHELREKHPTMYDGYDCLAMVHQAKGDTAQAIEYYRKVIALALESPELYDPGFADYYRDIIVSFERFPTDR
jgi:Tfp pilus assembly protein PilF